jgi:hypothetical protein
MQAIPARRAMPEGVSGLRTYVPGDVSPGVPGHVQLRRSYTRAQFKPYPKGRRRRSVPMIDQIIPPLDRLSRREHFTGPDDLVFVNVTGGVIDESALRRRFWAALDRGGLKRVRMHDLRHSYKPVGEVEIEPSQRAQFAEPQPGERGNGEERLVLLLGGMRGEEQCLGGLQHVEIVGCALRLTFDARERVCRDPPDALRALVDRLPIPRSLLIVFALSSSQSISTRQRSARSTVIASSGR